MSRPSAYCRTGIAVLAATMVPLATAYVFILAIAGPVLTRFAGTAARMVHAP